MSIRLSVEADDVEAERLLAHLKEHYNLSVSSKIYLLERVIAWLKISQAMTYHLIPDQISIDLSLVDKQPTFPVQIDKPEILAQR
jgi:hypothetical protein